LEGKKEYDYLELIINKQKTKETDTIDTEEIKEYQKSFQEEISEYELNLSNVMEENYTINNEFQMEKKQIYKGNGILKYIKKKKKWRGK
jgi:hypothetical protein